MQKFFIIAVIALMALGCSKKDDEGTSELPQTNGVEGQLENVGNEPETAIETNTNDSANESTADPVFKEYEYPASIFESTFSMGNTVSNIYKSSDSFAKVVDFYKQKFPDSPPQSGTTVYFGKTNEDGSGFTVTLTQLDNDTQIILRRDK